VCQSLRWHKNGFPAVNLELCLASQPTPVKFMFDEMWQEIQESSGEIFDIQEDSWNDDQDSNKLSSEEEFNRYLNSNFECA